MTVQRGTTSQIAIIKEATPGTTPATPVMIQMPVAGYQPKSTLNLIKSAQIRAHPFVDQIAQGRLDHAFTMDVELAGATHDPLFETMFGAVITAKSMKFTDALLSVTMEEQVAAGDFNQFTYTVFNQMTVSCAASDTAPVKVSLQGMAKTGTLDATTTLATSVTPAPGTVPYTFAGATAQLGGTATPIGSGSIQIQRQVDPLLVLGAVLPREYVPGAVTITGSMSVPYDATGAASGATIAPILTSFTDTAQVWKLADSTGANFRTLTIPKTNFASLGRNLTSRGQRMQDINWEAKYDSTSTTGVTLTTQ